MKYKITWRIIGLLLAMAMVTCETGSISVYANPSAVIEEQVEEGRQPEQEQPPEEETSEEEGISDPETPKEEELPGEAEPPDGEGSSSEQETADEEELAEESLLNEEKQIQADSDEGILSEEEFFSGYIDSGRRVESSHAGQSSIYARTVSNLPVRYDSREEGRITSVKNQSSFGLCWAFSVLGAMEAGALTKGIGSMDNMDLSELAVGYYSYNVAGRENYGTTAGDTLEISPSYSSYKWYSLGGNEYIAMWGLLSRMLPMEESYAPYTANIAAAEALVTSKAVYDRLYNPALHLNNVLIISGQDTSDIKTAIQQYGAVTTSYYHLESNYNKNDDGEVAYYQKTYTGTNHAVLIVGWDDDFDRSNFKTSCQPENNGAWLIKGSWGANTSYGKNGYYWISYEDISLADSFVFDVETTDDYDNIYQYDGGGSLTAVGTLASGSAAANVFTAEGNEILSAVSFATWSSNMSYSIQIYKNPETGNPESGEKMLTVPVTGMKVYSGYHTVEVPNVSLAKGDTFAIVVSLSAASGVTYYWIDRTVNADWYRCTSASAAGQSYFRKGTGYQWEDIGAGSSSAEGNARIKAYTQQGELSIIGMPEVHFWKGDTVQLDVDTRLKGNVTWSSDNEEAASVSESGLVTANGCGAAVISARVDGYTAQLTITVKEIEINGPNELYQGSSKDYTAVLLPDQETYVVKEWSVSDDAIAAIVQKDSKTGTASAQGNGTTEIIAKISDNYIVSKTIQCYEIPLSLEVSEAEIVFESETASARSVTAVLKPAEVMQDIIWSSADTDVAYVSADGVITPVAPGETVITVSSKAEEAVKKEITVIVCGLRISSEELTLMEEESTDLTVKMFGINGAVSWEITSGSEYIRISNEENDAVSIQALAGSRGNVAAVSAICGSYSRTCNIKLEKLTIPLADIVILNQLLQDGVISLSVDESTLMEIGRIPANTTETEPVVWSVENEQIASVEQDMETGDYYLTGLKEGTATVKAVIADRTAECTVKVLDCKIIFDNSGSTSIIRPIFGEPIGSKMPADPEREGYRFAGWYTQRDGKGQRITAETYVNESLTVYAYWIEATDGLWVKPVGDRFYTGTAIKPQVEVYQDDLLLRAGTDYSLSYRNNTGVNTSGDPAKDPTIIVKGRGNYAGSASVTFNILPIDIGGQSTIVTDLFTAYNQKVNKPKPVVMCDGKKLSNNKNYRLYYPDAGEGAYVQPGTYEIVIEGIGNYAGTRNISLNITTRILMDKVKINKINNQQYTGDYITPVPVIKHSGITLNENDYEIRWKNNKEIGTATAVIVGKGEYAGVKEISFKITGASLKNARIENLVIKKNYTGEPVKQECILTVNKGIDQLKEGQDYTVAYSKNENRGTATIIFTGINGYSGTVKKTFFIVPYNIKDDQSYLVQVEEGTITAAYAKGGAKPKVTVSFDGQFLTEGKDYTLTYANNKRAGETDSRKMPVVTIKGKGNFTGSRQKPFTIQKQDLSLMTVYAQDISYKNKMNNFTAKVTMTDLDSRKLSSGTDYQKNFIYTYEDGTPIESGAVLPIGTIVKVTMCAADNSNYTGTATAEYRLTAKSVSSAGITFTSKSYPYTGAPVEPQWDDMVVKVNGVVLKGGMPQDPDADYVILGYENNVNKGKGIITIAGVNEYGGRKTVNFNISGQYIKWFGK